MAVRTIKPEVQVLVTGFESVEGPTIHPDGNLYFSNPVGGGVYRRTPAGDVDQVVPRRKGAGGIAAHADGGIVISGRDLTRVVDGISTVLVAREDIPAPKGLRAIGFNDIAADAWGNVLAGCHLGEAEGGRRVRSCLVYVAPGAKPVIVYDLEFTNGIGHDSEATTLFHSDTDAHEIVVSRLRQGSRPVESHRFSTRERNGHPDGLAVDADGLAWAAMSGGGGIARFRSDGILDCWLQLPVERPLSVCFLGEDRDGLLITTIGDDIGAVANGGVLQADIPYRGAPVGLARI